MLRDNLEDVRVLYIHPKKSSSSTLAAETRYDAIFG